MVGLAHQKLELQTISPSFCLPPNTKIAKETIKGQEIYVLKAFQDLKLPKANILVEDIGG
jgi:hypothetical protein